MNKSTITLTFSERLENSTLKGFTLKELRNIENKFKKEGIATEIWNIGNGKKVNDAYLLIIRNGTSVFLKDLYTTDELLNEQKKLSTKIKKGPVSKKRKNEACLEGLQNNLKRFFGKKAKDLLCERKYCRDVSICHGNNKRKKVLITACLGKTLLLRFRWFHKKIPFDKSRNFILNDGDIYVMSEKAIGSDWKNAIIPTLQHAISFENPGSKTRKENCNFVNRGTGAGGSNTNKSGLEFENKTDIVKKYTIISKDNEKYTKIRFNDDVYKRTFILTPNRTLFRYTREFEYKNEFVDEANGCKWPDRCYIYKYNENGKRNKGIIFILETKMQQKGGSVWEKIQTAHFKIWQYNRTFPDFEIVYMYCLSNLFKNKCKAALDYLENELKVPVFWGEDENFKSDFVNYILNYLDLNYK